MSDSIRDVNMKNACEVYYFSDMQKCMKCGLLWDANDPFPPECKQNAHVPAGIFGRFIAFLFGTKAKGGTL